jgi:cytochrome c oxidase subunit III
MPTARHQIDVSALPDHAMDSRDPVWWGNTLMIFIETTTIALLVMAYFYLRRNFDEWPPPQVMTLPPIYHPVPDLPIPTIETIIFVLSCGLMYWTDLSARAKDNWRTRIGVAILFAIGIALTVLRFKEFHGLKFRWDENAYGSIIWTMIGMHLTYILAATLEFFILGLWLFTHPIDDKRALDVTLCGGYWYWVTGTWIVVYAVVYFGARLL